MITNLNNWDKIRTEILKIINPTEDENRQIKEIVDKTSASLMEWNHEHENYPVKLIEAHGSTGIKQTHLKNSADIDLFIFLEPKKYSEFLPLKNDKKSKEKLNKLFYELCSNWLMPSLKKNGFSDVILSYAEHPYVSAIYKTYEIDVVLAFLLTEDELLKTGPITAVDRTFYHSMFVKQNLTERQREDVRILKKFFKTHFSYGDKAPIGRGGFIGYAIELLIFHFGDIFTVFENFGNLHNIPVDYYNRKENELRKSARLTKDLLLIMDPTDKKRNVGASISPRAWIYCTDAIKNIMENPSISTIINEDPNEIDKDSEKPNENFVVIEFKQVSDSHYTKIRDKLYSIAESIQNVALYEKDRSIRFPDVDYVIYFNPANKIYIIAFYTGKRELNNSYLRKGPKADEKSPHYRKFIEKHKEKIIIKEGFCLINQKREYTKFLSLIQSEVEKRIFDEIKLLNISTSGQINNSEAEKALYILRFCILPYNDKLRKVLKEKIKPKKKTEARFIFISLK